MAGKKGGFVGSHYYYDDYCLSLNSQVASQVKEDEEAARGEDVAETKSRKIDDLCMERSSFRSREKIVDFIAGS